MPKTGENKEMIGHEAILQELKQLADQGDLGHGYLFFGPTMVGKKLTARLFAEYLEGAADAEEKVLNDFKLIDARKGSSIGIDAIREIKHFLWQKPNVSARRTLVIDDAELMTTEAQNALLKVTEEPPTSSLLLLVTSDLESILPTITSRLPRIYFGPVSHKVIAQWLEKNSAIAKKVFGKPGLAWRLLHDEAFQEQLTLAERFLQSSAVTRRDVIKKIIEPDEFNFRKFLDAIIMTLAWRGVSGKNAAIWHKALALYERETNVSLNPRLQLETLLA
jgi:DNA polymerase III gamma/tau subunit